MGIVCPSGALRRYRASALDLRTTPNDTSQRMLNALEVGTRVPIHRHPKISETVACLEGCLEWVFYEELPNILRN